jgi:hypothetical protein
MTASIKVAFTTLLLTTIGQVKAAEITFDKHLIPFLEDNCYDCHGYGTKKGDLSLDQYDTPEKLKTDKKTWQTVMFNIKNHVMPPAKTKTQPTPEERELIVHYLDDLIFPCDCSNPDPGRVTIRRLNRIEYNNTMADLIGVDIKPANDFPDDDTGYGFDNIGDVLSLSPVLMERYLIAADKVLDAAIVEGTPEPQTRKFSPALLRGGKRAGAKERQLSGEEEIYVEHKISYAGGYILELDARTDAAGKDGTPIILKIDGKEIANDAVRGGTGSTFSGKILLQPGKHKFSVCSARSGSLFIPYINIKGPYNAKNIELPESHTRIFTSTDRDRKAAFNIVKRFSTMAFRRPVQTDEVNRLLRFFDEATTAGETFENAIKVALKATLVSPHFLFRMEWQKDPNNPDAVFDVTEYSLANRLSYFLWSSMPDTELLSLAFKKQLKANFQQQVTRMLADPKANALAENFAGQWLEIRNIAIVTPDKDKFPDFTPDLRKSMQKETELFFQHIQRQNKSVLDFLNADYTFLNGTLAKHYGISGVTGSEFKQVSLKSTPRRGVLTQGSVLTVSSDPNRTSPVKRGKWVLENLLGTPPPPPPPNVPPLEDGNGAELKGTLRSRMEQHRDNPACYSCHALMDPIGFGLENFDAVGAWRTTESGQPVEAIGTLATGESFTGPIELNTILTQKKKKLFVECLVRKMLTYALGRGLEYYDKCAVNDIMARLEKKDYAFNELIFAIVESTPFQKRRGDGFKEP